MLWGELTLSSLFPNRCDRICHPPQIFILLLCNLVAKVASSPQGLLASRYLLSSQSPLCASLSNSRVLLLVWTLPGFLTFLPAPSTHTHVSHYRCFCPWWTHSCLW